MQDSNWKVLEAIQCNQNDSYGFHGEIHLHKVSGFSFQRTEVRRQKTDEKLQDLTVYLSSVICLLTPETKNIGLFKELS
jgi:hypothetical protein